MQNSAKITNMYKEEKWQASKSKTSKNTRFIHINVGGNLDT